MSHPDEKFLAELPGIVAAEIAALKASVPIVEGNHGPVAERYRAQLFDTLTRVEYAASVARQFVAHSPGEEWLYLGAHDSLSKLVVDCVALNNRFRIASDAHGEA